MSNKKIFFSLLCIVIGILSFIYFFCIFKRNDRYGPYPVYTNFHITIPNNYSLNGIDVSRYQDSIDWSRVNKMKVGNNKINFVILKATQGINIVDSKLKYNSISLKRLKLTRGFYHYLEPCIDGNEQANHFLGHISLEKGDIRPVVDIEELSNRDFQTMRVNLKKWLETVELKTKSTPIIYTSVNFYNSYLNGYFDRYPIWVSHYNNQDTPGIACKWTFWQHSNKGRVDGIREKVDFNVFNGDSLEFRKYLIN